MTGQSLRILLLDDNPDDRLLTIEALGREFSELQVEQVIDTEAFARALEADEFDLVITDYRLRWTDGLAVLNTVKDHWPDCPVIMFTATGSEEIAVAAMKAGLDDYVLKSAKHFVRLPAAVRLTLERARQRQSTREAEARYRSLFEGVPVGLYRTTPAGQFLDANPALVEMLGYPDREALLAVNAVDLYLDAEGYQRLQAQLERESVGLDLEVQLLRYGGISIWAKCNARAVRDTDGQMLYYEGSLKDITEHKQAEAALRESEEKYRNVVERANDGIVIVQDQLIKYVNPRLAAMTGYAVEELTGTPFTDYVHPDEHSILAERYQRRMAGEDVPPLYETVVRHKNDGKIYIEINAGIITYQGKPADLVIVRDLTERKRAEEALQQSEARLAAILDNALEAIISIDETQRIILFNQGAEQIFGYSSAEAIGQSLDLLLPEKFETIHRNHFEAFGRSALTARRMGKDQEAFGRRKNGEVFPAEGSVSKLEVKGQRIFTVILRDVTERKQAEEALQDSIQQMKIAYQQASIYAQELKEKITEHQRAEESVRHYATRLEALREIEQAILTARSVEEIAQTALRHIWQLVPCQQVSIATFDLKAQEAVVLAVHPGGSETSLAAGKRFPLEEFGNIEELRQGQVLLIQDLLTHVQPSSTDQALQAEGIRAVINLPLIAHSELIGCLNMAAETPGAFGEGDIATAREVADSLAVVIQNARLLDAIIKHRAELQRLSTQLINTQEAERKRIAHELHDELGQALTAISINLGAIEGELPLAFPPVARERLAEAISLADQTLEQVREMSLDLRPAMLDDLGLVPTLSWYVNRYSARANIAVEFETIDFEERLSGEIETVLYRLVQEALTNVARHAQAKRVRLRLKRKDAAIVVLIEDDGQGFDVREVTNLRAPKYGLGLVGMRERVTYLGGKLNVQSHPGQGTRLSIELPWRAES